MGDSVGCNPPRLDVSIGRGTLCLQIGGKLVAVAGNHLGRYVFDRTWWTRTPRDATRTVSDDVPDAIEQDACHVERRQLVMWSGVSCIQCVRSVCVCDYCVVRVCVCA